QIKGWRLTLRLKVKDPSKSVEMRAALLRDVPVEPAKPAKPAKPSKQDKAAAKQAKADKPAEQPAADAASTTGAPATTEQVLTETWSYQ
ncbi:glucan biosynthesis protein G, partial [Pseudomonas frederiksbergensis]|nr:glucan biosynthesis protein G [Pseudomonas frederiksbergensis]